MKNTSLFRILCFCFSFLILAGMLPLNALAATYYVSTGYELGMSWDMTANESSDTSNTFIMTNNIDMGDTWPLTTKEDREYIITSEDGKDYTLNGASFWQQPGTSGGKVIIEADVTGSLSAVRDVEVIIEGDLSTGAGPSIYAAGGSTIEGVYALEEGAFTETVMSAVIASYEKTKKLGK